MPRQPRVDGKAVVRALKKAGFAEKRVRGSHHILVNDAGRRVIVPVHASQIIPPGTLANILSQANVSQDELRRLLS